MSRIPASSSTTRTRSCGDTMAAIIAASGCRYAPRTCNAPDSRDGAERRAPPDRWTTIGAVTESESKAHSSGGEHGAVLESAPGRPYEGVYLFDSTGRRVASTRADDLVTPPVRDLADLESRFVQPDGLPLGLDRRG